MSMSSSATRGRWSNARTEDTSGGIIPHAGRAALQDPKDALIDAIGCPLVCLLKTTRWRLDRSLERPTMKMILITGAPSGDHPQLPYCSSDGPYDGAESDAHHG